MKVSLTENRMGDFQIKISRGSELIKEISCDEFGCKDISNTVKSIKFLKKANEDYLKDVVAKEKAVNVASTKIAKPDESDEEEDLCGAEEDEDETEPPKDKKAKIL